ncbi:hypothetical protein HFC70_15075 [Agrobacterium sp. a22-2]|uniref:hypothetical protein n=1 Tax=Agrobacterium sp. a22-2 TaxID=2283840 RepID=UPI001447D203|nr:hypothetical protein [Agrobacterium sp. a22-2]NKN37673.1 hypothetical protein [Agrobacterium sp. a22-2]
MARSKDLYSLNDIGAVLVKARLLTSDVLSPFNQQWLTLHQRSVEVMKRREQKPEKHRIFAAPDFAHSHLWGAIFSANCYFLYFEIFTATSGYQSDLDINSAAIDAAHIHADVVPIDLYNFRETIFSPEILEICGGDIKELKAIFDLDFHNLTEARDAVAHAHDRQFARVRKASLNAEVGSRSLSERGKNFLSSSGRDFLFDFRICQFEKLISNLMMKLV